MPDVGDATIPRLVVTPYDGTTVAAFTVTDGADVVSTPAVSVTSEDPSTGQVWDGDQALVYTKSGLWVLGWEVAGTGKGKQATKVQVTPSPTVGRGFVWATTTDLANWIDDTPPLDARRMLAHATRKVRALVQMAIYDVDTAGEPTDVDVIAAVRDATCDLAQWWIQSGDEHGARSLFTSVSIGGVSLSRGGRGNGTSDTPAVPPSTYDVLRLAGLLDHHPISW